MLKSPGVVVGGSAATGSQQHTGRNRAGAAAGGGNNKRQSGGGTPRAPEGWRRMYWVDVDYLEAAAAAIRVRVPLTAALLVEAWLEDRHGTVSLDDADAAAKRLRATATATATATAAGAATATATATPAEEIPDHVRLLLEAQAGLSEPDGIYVAAITRFDQLRLYEHEGAWGEALTGHDLTLRHVGVGFGSSAPGHQDAIDGYPAADGVPSLLDVSCVPPPGGLRREVAEVRFEAAWRAGRWDLPRSIPYLHPPPAR